jgi:uncharacterized membrane protein
MTKSNKLSPLAGQQTAEPAPPDVAFGLERIVFFSDAVMAIAITLLAIDLKVPDLAPEVAQVQLALHLAALGPRIMSFVISFTVIGIYWMSHHRYFGFIKRYDNRLMMLNLVFLLFIATMPFIASLLGQYAYAPLGVIAYAGEVAALGLSMSTVWLYASGGHRLVDKTLDPQVIRQMSIRAIVAPLIFLLSMPVGWFSPPAAVVVWWISPLVVLLAVRVAGHAKT